VRAAQNPGQWAAGFVGGSYYPPTGASNAAILKQWLTWIAQQATLAYEGDNGQPGLGAGTVPVIT